MCSLVQVKSKFEREFRRFSVDRSSLASWEALHQLLLEVHCLPPHTDIALSYSLPGALDLLPISSDEELTAAVLTAAPLLRVFVHQRSSEVTVEYESGGEDRCSECSESSSFEGDGEGGREGEREGDGGGGREGEGGGGREGVREEEGGGAREGEGGRGREGERGEEGGGEDASCTEDRASDSGGWRTTSHNVCSSQSGPCHELERVSGCGCVEVECDQSAVSGMVVGSGDSQQMECDGISDRAGSEGDALAIAGEDDGMVVGSDTPGSQQMDFEFRPVTPPSPPLSDSDSDATREQSVRLSPTLPPHPLLSTALWDGYQEIAQDSGIVRRTQQPHSPSPEGGSTLTAATVTVDMLPPHPLFQMLAGTKVTANSSVEVPTEELKQLTLNTAPSPHTSSPPPLRQRSEFDYYSMPTKTHNQVDFPYVIELYDFDSALKTRDLLQELHKEYSREEFRLKWVDDTHAIGIFASSKQAWLAAKAPYCRFKTRMVQEGTEQSLAVAEKLAADMRPSGRKEPKPKQTAMVARRMVANALRMRIPVSPEQREKERRELQRAREEKHSQSINT